MNKIRHLALFYAASIAGSILAVEFFSEELPGFTRVFVFLLIFLIAVVMVSDLLLDLRDLREREHRRKHV